VAGAKVSATRPIHEGVGGDSKHLLLVDRERRNETAELPASSVVAAGARGLREPAMRSQSEETEGQSLRVQPRRLSELGTAVKEPG
jgi:hypothetical protein